VDQDQVSRPLARLLEHAQQDRRRASRRCRPHLVRPGSRRH
jgi:hypothetical protein